MNSTPQNCVLIGVDVGASEVKTHQALVLSSEERPTLGLGSASASCCYDRVSGFEPVPLASQLEAFERAEVELEDLEREQGRLWIEATASSVHAVSVQARNPRVLIGVGTPGLKSKDGRGILVMRNGPRMPDFADELERELEQRGLQLLSPVGPLGSDGDHCGRGEEAAPTGLFRDVQNAYYIGGGTGVAEALKLKGQLISMDRVSSWLPKSWQMSNTIGRNFDDLVSTRGINATYAADAGRPHPIDRDEYPEERALEGDVVAEAVMREAAVALAELIFSRLVTLSGLNAGANGPHPFVGAHLERVIIGQRLGRIYADPRFLHVFRERVEGALAHEISAAHLEELEQRYLVSSRLRGGFVRASRLRGAPALGAAMHALESFEGGN